MILWQQDQLVLFCSAENPLAKKHKIALSDLEQADFILREQGSGTRYMFEMHIGQHMQRRHLRMELNQTEAIKSLVHSGEAISCLSELCIAKELEQGLLKVLSHPFPPMKRQLWLLQNKKKYKSERVRRLQEVLTSVY